MNLELADTTVAHHRQDDDLKPMLLSRAQWMRVVEAMHLTRQQAKIVELILRGARDKQIAQILRLQMPTVRTHLRAIYRNHHLGDRVQLVLHCFAIIWDGNGGTSS